MNVLDVRVIRVANLAVVFAFLTACGSQQVKPSEQPVAAAAQISKPVASAAKAKSAKERVIDELLASAQQAFRDDKLTTPSHDNAYDQFQSVLALDPANSSARAGVQAILISYAEWARNAIASGDYAGAQGYLNQAQLYFPANPLLMELQQTIAKAKQQRKQQEQVVLAQEPPAERTEFIDSEENEAGDKGVKVGAGKYLSENVYLELERSSDPTHPWQGNILIELTPSISLESTTGGAKGGSAELLWKRDY